MADEYLLFVGIDWATETHQVCAIDQDRRVVLQRRTEHSAGDLAKLVKELLELAGGVVEQVAVAIETPRGAVVETLLENKIHVYSVNPKQLDRFRDRHTVAGAKDDRRDAFVLADSLRTDRACFRRVVVDEPLVIQLREVVRAEDEIKLEFGRCANQLRDAVYRYLPDVLKLCPAADEPWFWALLELARSPDRAKHARPGSISRVLREHRIRRLTVDEIRAVLRTQPPTVAPGVVEATTTHIQLLVPRLRLLHTQLRQCEKASEALLDKLAEQTTEGDAEKNPGKKREHRDVEILLSLPGVGRVVAATMLAEASQALKARDYHALRIQAGVAPVTEQTGKQSHSPKSKRRVKVIMRHACNHRLRAALHHWANSSVLHEERTKGLYAASRARGHSHGRALRGVGDRLLGVLVAMLRDGTTFDAAHVAASKKTG